MVRLLDTLLAYFAEQKACIDHEHHLKRICNVLPEVVIGLLHVVTGHKKFVAATFTMKPTNLDHLICLIADP